MISKRAAYLSFLVAAVPLAVACKGKGEDKAASASALEASCKSAGAAFAKSFAPMVVKNSDSDKKPEMERAIESTIVDTCEKDQWEHEVLKCLATIPVGKNAFCLDMLPKEKNAKFEEAVKSAQRKVLGVPSADSATTGSPAGALPTLAPPVNLRGKVFALGERIGFAATRRTITGSSPQIDAAFSEAKSLAGAFDLTLPDLPELKGSRPENGAAALHYVLDETDAAFAPKISAKAGKDAAGLFELGIKSQLLRMLYIGDKKDDLVDSIVGGMKGNAGLGKLPPDLASPLFAKIETLVTPDDLEKALDAVDTATAAKLASEPPSPAH